MSSRRATAGPSNHYKSGDEALIVGVFMHKGGVGKTTMLGMLGAMLAKQGNTVILVDADPQGSLTSFFAESGITIPEEPSDVEGEEGSEDEDGSEGVDSDVLLPFGDKQLVLPPLECDRLRRTDALPAEYLHQIRLWCKGKDDLLTVMNRTMEDKDFVARPTPVNVGDYGDRLLLVPGNPRLSDFAHNLQQNKTTGLSTQCFGAFGRAMRNMAASVGAQFVIVDLGPHNDILHKVIITSCNVVQGVVDACHYTSYSLYNMLHNDLPKWIKWFKGFAPKHRTGPYAYNQHFPRLLPFLGWGYNMKNNYVQWSASNFFETMRQTIAGETADEDTDRLPSEVKELFVPIQKRGRKELSMLVPFMRHLYYLPVAEECGRPIFDLTDDNLQRYYLSSVKELEVSQLEKEMALVNNRFKGLASKYGVLRKAIIAQRQAQKDEKKKKKKEEKKKRNRDGEGPSGSGSGSAGPRAGHGGCGNGGGAGRGGAQPTGAAKRKRAAPQRVAPPSTG